MDQTMEEMKRKKGRARGALDGGDVKQAGRKGNVAREPERN